MRTTLDLREPLIEEARRLLGFKSKTETVVVSLQELVRKKRIEELNSMLGKVKLDIDLPKSRRRAASELDPGRHVDGDFTEMAALGFVQVHKI